jgi:hypothetical protein
LEDWRGSKTGACVEQFYCMVNGGLLRRV